MVLLHFMLPFNCSGMGFGTPSLPPSLPLFLLISSYLSTFGLRFAFLTGIFPMCARVYQVFPTSLTRIRSSFRHVLSSVWYVRIIKGFCLRSQFSSTTNKKNLWRWGCWAQLLFVVKVQSLKYSWSPPKWSYSWMDWRHWRVLALLSHFSALTDRCTENYVHARRNKKNQVPWIFWTLLKRKTRSSLLH